MIKFSKLALTLIGATCLVGSAVATPMVGFIVPHGASQASTYGNKTYIFYALTQTSGVSKHTVIGGVSEDALGDTHQLQIPFPGGLCTSPQSCPPIYMVATAGTTNALQQSAQDPILGEWIPNSQPTTWNAVQFSPASWTKK